MWACFFREGVLLVLRADWGDPRQETERQLAPCDVEGVSGELPRELEEDEDVSSDGKSYLDWWVRDGRCPLLLELSDVLSPFSAPVGFGGLLVARSICSLSTTCLRRTRACELSCTVSDMSSVAAAILSPSSLMSLVLLSMELAASCTVDLSSSRLSCLASSTGATRGTSNSRRGCMGLGGAVRIRGLRF